MAKRKVDKELRCCVITLVFLFIFIIVFSKLFSKLPKLPPEEEEKLRKEIEENPYLYFEPLYP